jgi:hypothetical protein
MQMQRILLGIAMAIGAGAGLLQSPHAEAVQAVMKVNGRQLIDSNNQVFVARGIEGWFGNTGQSNIQGLVDNIAAQGFNAVRMQLLTEDLVKIEALIKAFHAKGMVVYLTDSNMPGNMSDDNPNGRAAAEWFGIQGVKDMINRNPYNLVLDATIEELGLGENPADVVEWLATQKDFITKFRSWGYTQPLTIGTLDQGRHLRALLDHGQELLDFDPQHKLVFNAQMYWGNYTGSWNYQENNGFSPGDAGIVEAMEAIEAKPYVIQIGLDGYDSGGNWADVPYELMMTHAESKKIGYLFWEWKDPNFNNLNSLVFDQMQPFNLTALGEVVLNQHPQSIKKTSRLVAPANAVTYTNATDVPIVDNANVTSSIVVANRPGKAPFNSTLTVKLAHTARGQLKVELIAPDFHRYLVHYRTGGTSNNLNKTMSLNLSSEDLVGTWMLIVNDNVVGDVGKIDSWSLKF